MVRDRYGSKDALLQTVFEEFARQLLPAVRSERTGTGLDHVLGQIDDLLNAVEQEPETMRAMIVLTFETVGPLQSFAGEHLRLRRAMNVQTQTRQKLKLPLRRSKKWKRALSYISHSSRRGSALLSVPIFHSQFCH